MCCYASAASKINLQHPCSLYELWIWFDIWLFYFTRVSLDNHHHHHVEQNRSRILRLWGELGLGLKGLTSVQFEAVEDGWAQLLTRWFESSPWISLFNLVCFWSNDAGAATQSLLSRLGLKGPLHSSPLTNQSLITYYILLPFNNRRHLVLINISICLIMCCLLHIFLVLISVVSSWYTEIFQHIIC